MSEPGSNLKTLIAIANVTRSELSRQTGVPQAVIYRLYTGENTNPKLATIQKLAAYFNVSSSQLIGETPLPVDKAFYRYHQKKKHIWNRVPLIAWKDTATWPDALPVYKQNKDTRYVSTDACTDKTAYAVIVENSAMQRVFPKGTCVIADPKRPPTPRCFVIMRFKDETVTRIRQLLLRNASARVQPLDDDLATLRATPLTPGDRILATVVQAKFNRQIFHY